MLLGLAIRDLCNHLLKLYSGKLNGKALDLVVDPGFETSIQLDMKLNLNLNPIVCRNAAVLELMNLHQLQEDYKQASAEQTVIHWTEPGSKLPSCSVSQRCAHVAEHILTLPERLIHLDDLVKQLQNKYKQK